MANYQPATLDKYTQIIDVLQKAVLLDMADKGLQKGVIPNWRFDVVKETYGEPATLQIDFREDGVYLSVVPSRPESIPGVVYEDIDAETY